jgi:hypothetical protein
MGRIFLSGPDGRERATAYFGADSGEYSHEGSYDVANDGIITDVEVSHARDRLQEEINRRVCGYGGPAGLGGWGGINEVCVQPWNMGGPARESTPDGYSMPITVRLTETHRIPVAYVFSSYETVERQVTMTARWESGSVRLYQCTPPPYTPPPPPPPPPDVAKWFRETGSAIAEGIRSFSGEMQAVADSASRSLHRLFS